MLQKPLDHKDDIMLDTYLGYMLGSNKFNEFEYSHMMRILPEIFHGFIDEDFQSSQFFKFFKNEDKKTPVEVEEQVDSQCLDPIFFKPTKKTAKRDENPNCF